MCTVIVRTEAGRPPHVLALRDELVSREFDDPACWWPDQPAVLGGRDRVAGGTWCATDVARGVTALVVNRPQRRLAEPGAPSRGVLPLRGVRDLQAWPEHLDVGGMASFGLVLVEPASLTSWDFDGTDLVRTDLDAGTHIITSGEAESGKAERYLPAFTRARPEDWLDLVTAETPTDDPAALVVHHPAGEQVFATVFGQYLLAVPGRALLSYSRTPWLPGWTVRP